jgi:hypothetical protein
MLNVIDPSSEGGSKLAKVEWNAYRYKLFRDKSDKHGVMIFGLSIRESVHIEDFLKALPETRKLEVNAVESYQTPAVQIN